MNITKITNETNVKYDPFLVESLVKSNDASKSTNKVQNDRTDWSSEILKEGISRLENSIQSNEDTSPLNLKSAPTVDTFQDAKKVLSEIDTSDLVKNINNIFSGLNAEKISNLFLEEANAVV